MALIKFNNVGIKGVSACVPKDVSKNIELLSVLNPEEVDKTINIIGIHEKRIVKPDVCASDLCYKAADKLITDLCIDPKSIDMLIFVSQTADYTMPATAPILQHRLGLSSSTACFDVNLACSGYVYSLSTAFSYAMSNGIDRVLLLVGETISKIISQQDKVNAPLYGDAGTATIIEAGDYSNSYFSLNTDGSGKNHIIIPAGGCRNPSNSDNLKMREREESNIRSDHQIYMDGMEVFNFTMRTVPRDIKKIMKFARVDFSDIDYLVFHQSNKFMTDFFSKKLKCPLSKVPYSLGKYGNVSSATIPLTISSELSNNTSNSNKKIIMSGFGAGLSWGSAILDFKGAHVSEVIEY